MWGEGALKSLSLAHSHIHAHKHMHTHTHTYAIKYARSHSTKTQGVATKLRSWLADSGILECDTQNRRDNIKRSSSPGAECTWRSSRPSSHGRWTLDTSFCQTL